MRSEPVEPLPTTWQFPPLDDADEEDLVGVGADLEPGTLLAAYRTGLFPMPVGRDGPLGWWSPDPRGVLPLDGLIVSRSLRRSLRRYEIRVDTEFERVMRACGARDRAGGWITEPFVVAYTRLHELGWAHSVECWTRSRARRRFVRHRDRWFLRRRVDVPAQGGRVEGRLGRPRRPIESRGLPIA